jgi:hypothetical protein
MCDLVALILKMHEGIQTNFDDFKFTPSFTVHTGNVLVFLYRTAEKKFAWHNLCVCVCVFVGGGGRWEKV